ncbi:MAG: M15 family metallopeptidase [Spirochaetes bacterium]|jgi:peptidoglycan L-alanyl-D-glutamate endopeptidase CwlK|nr:M15 family metallopeptidase [Spirochaetota bacterium]
MKITLFVKIISIFMFFLGSFVAAQAPVLVDSSMTLKEALKGVNSDCPEWILSNQALIEVYYYGFDGKLHKGQIVADFRLADDLRAVFKIIHDTKFAVKQVKPVSDYNWDDFKSMKADNTSAFNYRVVPFSKTLSKHAYGCAIDINPVENPYYTKDAVYPEGAVYDPTAPGTLSASDRIVAEFKKRGWRWGGDWKNKDYQHFDITLEKKAAMGNKKYYVWPWAVK